MRSRVSVNPPMSQPPFVGRQAELQRLQQFLDTAIAGQAQVVFVAGEAGAVLSGPKPMSYSPGYYAVFFADPSGNALEVYFRPD